MASIINKDEFISKYLIGTNSREVMLFNSDRIAVGVKEHDSFSLGHVNLNWSYSMVNILKNKNNIYLSFFPQLKDINPELILKFPIEINKDGSIECFDRFSGDKKTLFIYEKKIS